MVNPWNKALCPASIHTSDYTLLSATTDIASTMVFIYSPYCTKPGVFDFYDCNSNYQTL